MECFIPLEADDGSCQLRHGISLATIGAIPV